ncbi:MAG: tyrosine-type recombinase/integrase [Nitrospinae bacterium]|nr:tyrosine-type recombinase/integrase [Nitrospinota bacterium]
MKIRDRVLVLTGLSFGSRISEGLGLTFGDVSGSYVQIKASKQGYNTSYPIPEAYKMAVVELKAHYEDQGITVTDETPLFLSRNGDNKPITRQQASLMVKAVCKALGIDGKINTHSFRKAFVTKIYEMTGHDLVKTKAYSRHKSIASLDYYIATTMDTGLVRELSW